MARVTPLMTARISRAVLVATLGLVASPAGCSSPDPAPAAVAQIGHGRSPCKYIHAVVAPRRQSSRIGISTGLTRKGPASMTESRRMDGMPSSREEEEEEEGGDLVGGEETERRKGNFFTKFLF